MSRTTTVRNRQSFKKPPRAATLAQRRGNSLSAARLSKLFPDATRRHVGANKKHAKRQEITAGTSLSLLETHGSCVSPKRFSFLPKTETPPWPTRPRPKTLRPPSAPSWQNSNG